MLFCAVVCLSNMKWNVSYSVVQFAERPHLSFYRSWAQGANQVQLQKLFIVKTQQNITWIRITESLSWKGL